MGGLSSFMMTPVTLQTRQECECSAMGSGAASALNCSLHTGQFALREDAGAGGTVGGAPVDEAGVGVVAEVDGVRVGGELGASVGAVAVAKAVAEGGDVGDVGDEEEIGGDAGARGAQASTHAEVFSADRPACRDIESKGRRVKLCRA